MKTPRKSKAPAKKTRGGTKGNRAHFGSRVGNNVSLFIDGSLDQRSLPARRYREITYSIGSDLGGYDSLSEFQKQLTRRSAALSVLCELDECRIARGEDIDAGRFGAMVNTLNRLGQTLGVRREVIDLQPSLRELLAQKVAERAQEAAEDEEEDEAADGEG
jgi:hypothetical protein